MQNKSNTILIQKEGEVVTKLSKLKMFNILVFALIPLLVVAMVTTVTLAAMTAGGYGQNTINIGKLGTVDCTAVAANGVYPGNKATATLTLKYAKSGSYNANAVTVSGFTIDSVTIKSGETTLASFSSATNGAYGPISNIILDKDSYTIQLDSTADAVLSFDITAGAGTKREYGEDGVSDSRNDSANDNVNFLVNSATAIEISFTLQVDQSGTGFTA